jgi:hypothetical protein
MSWLDFLTSHKQKRRRAAIAAGLQTGLFQECPVCRDITERQAPESLVAQTEALAAQWMASGDERVATFGGDLNALKQEIREIKRTAPFDCTCERI